MAMKSTIMILMALVLAVATAATTMTAFAHPKKKHHQITEQMTDSIHATSQAILRLKVRRMPNTYQPPNNNRTFATPKQN